MEHELSMHSPISSPGTATPIPKRIMSILLCVIFSEPFTSSLFYPFMYFMVRDFQVAPTDADIGFYAGFLAATFSIAQFCTSLMWGCLSDRIGRRPVLLIGLFGNAVSMVGFGLSKSYRMALIMRAMTGLLNGNIGVTKSIIAEITDDSNIATAFGLFNITWALGSILGPVVGGLLNQPTTRLAPIFGGISFLAEYPYFLPCFVSSLVSIAGFVVGIFWLPETMHSFHVDPIFLDEEANLLSNTDGQASLIMNEANLVVPLDVQSATSGAQKESMAIAETRPAISRLASVLSYDRIRDRRLDAAYLSGSSAIRRRTSSSVGAYMYENPQTRQSSSHRSIFHLPDASDFITSRSGAISDYAAVSAMLDRGIGSIGRFSVQSIDSRPDGGVSSSLPTAANLLRSSSSSSPRYSSFRASLQTTAETPKNAQTHPNAEIPNSPLAHVADIETEEFAEIVLNPGGLSIDTIKTIFAYSFLALGNAIIDEIYNLWTVERPRLGGLGFNSVHIGVTLAAVGLFDVLFQVYAYGPCQKMLGCVRLFQVSIFVYGPAVAMLPFVPLLLTAIPWENTGAMDLFDSFPTAAKALTLSVLLVLLMIKCVCQLFGYTAVMIMVNNSATPYNLGMINGISQTSASFARAVGPAVAGTLWSWSLQNHLSFPFNQYFVFFLVFGIFALTTLQSSVLSTRLNHKLDWSSY